jgi:uncharacterized protein YecA (UPF0149 family)
MLQTYNNNNISNLKSVSQKIDAEMKVYLVDGKTLDTFVVAVTTKQKFNQIIDSSPFGYQQTFVLRLQFKEKLLKSLFSKIEQNVKKKMKITFGIRTLS